MRYSSLPEAVPTHFDFSGLPDDLGSRTSALWLAGSMLGTGAVIAFDRPLSASCACGDLAQFATAPTLVPRPRPKMRPHHPGGTDSQERFESARRADGKFGGGGVHRDLVHVLTAEDRSRELGKFLVSRGPWLRGPQVDGTFHRSRLLVQPGAARGLPQPVGGVDRQGTRGPRGR